MNVMHRFVAMVAVLVAVGCAQRPAEPPDTRAADEAAIRAAVTEWSAAARAKDVAKFVSFYADDGVVMMAGFPDISGIAAIREGIAA